MAVEGLVFGTDAIAIYGYRDLEAKGGYAGFHGPVEVGGSLIKTGGGFRIDHPLDPARKYLNHSFVESSERKNVYDGVAVLDARGGRRGHALLGAGRPAGTRREVLTRPAFWNTFPETVSSRDQSPCVHGRPQAFR